MTLRSRLAAAGIDPDRLRDILDAEGLRVVPVEATAEMAKEGGKTADSDMGYRIWDTAARECYAAMLAAYPDPLAQEPNNMEITNVT